MKIMTTMMTTTTVMMTMFILTTILSKKSMTSREKNSPFECGFTPMNSARKSFSIHFFLIATMFLIFDIEISIILPMTITKMTEPTKWMSSSIVVMTILIMGLYHEWNNGMLEWTK
nr:NADH dehydrogenase subunit 3 [Tropiduchidae sp. 1 WQW-2023a]